MFGWAVIGGDLALWFVVVCVREYEVVTGGPRNEPFASGVGWFQRKFAHRLVRVVVISSSYLRVEVTS